MSVLEKITPWLQTFPLWQGELAVDSLQPVPGSVGLFPQGLQEVSRREDVLGNVETVNRLELMLCRVSDGDGKQAAAWLLALQDWVNGQSAAGLAPRLGDVPAREKILARQGRLSAPAQTGTGRYAVNITAEYVTKMHNTSSQGEVLNE